MSAGRISLLLASHSWLNPISLLNSYINYNRANWKDFCVCIENSLSGHFYPTNEKTSEIIFRRAIQSAVMIPMGNTTVGIFNLLFNRIGELSAIVNRIIKEDRWNKRINDSNNVPI